MSEEVTPPSMRAMILSIYLGGLIDRLERGETKEVIEELRKAQKAVATNPPADHPQKENTNAETQN